LQKSDNSDIKFKDSDNLKSWVRAMAAWTESNAKADGLKTGGAVMFTGYGTCNV